jgi:hypothetical protein
MVFENFSDDDLLQAATRYYIGRRTIAANWHAQMLAKSWHLLSDNTRRIIYRDILEADDLGDRMDVEQWLHVLRVADAMESERVVE